jgi:outer membrane receptor protein involved in Fe transport
LKTGVRYEFTFINAGFEKRDEELNDNIPDYGVFVPSINISQVLKHGRTVKLGYARRIQRPGIQFLNPNMNTANPYNISTGNPYLSPELADNLEVGMGKQLKSGYVHVALFGRNTGKMISGVRDTLSETLNAEEVSVISTTYENIGRENAIGVNLFATGTLFSKWQIGLGGTLYRTHLSNDAPGLTASNSGFVASGYVSTSLNLDKGWVIQGFSGGRGKQIQLQGHQSGFIFYNVGFRKDLKNKKGSFGIAAENFFNHPFKARTVTLSPVISQYSVTGMYNAGIRFKFTYRIGEMKVDGIARKKKSIKNDDVKATDTDANNSGAGQTVR